MYLWQLSGYHRCLTRLMLFWLGGRTETEHEFTLQFAIRHRQFLLFRIEHIFHRVQQYLYHLNVRKYTTLSAGMSIAYFIPQVQSNSTLWCPSFFCGEGPA